MLSKKTAVLSAFATLFGVSAPPPSEDIHASGWRAGTRQKRSYNPNGLTSATTTQDDPCARALCASRGSEEMAPDKISYVRICFATERSVRLYLLSAADGWFARKLASQ